MRRFGAAVIRGAPTPLAYRLRGLAERAAFLLGASSAELPPIFHHWSNRCVLPKFQALGYSSPQDVYVQHISRRANQTGRGVRCLSLASGRGDIELEVVRALVDRGVEGVHVTCTDLSEPLLRLAARGAREAGLTRHFQYRCGDLNQTLRTAGPYDVVIANQCLHHFVELERIFDAVHAALAPDGVFVMSDVIGRNGHQLWPEALVEFDRFWDELPDTYRHDRVRGRTLERFDNHDHSDVGFEGIRAQDVLPCLLERFEVEDFIPFGCITLPFVERRFGWNFDPGREFDRDFIDRVADRDEALLNAGRLKPTQLVAALRTGPARLRSWGALTPEACVRPVDA